jgi:hypothetical protein
MQAISGRRVKEDSSFINLADIVAMAIDLTGGVYVNNEMQHSIHEGDAYSFDIDGTISASTSL